MRDSAPNVTITTYIQDETKQKGASNVQGGAARLEASSIGTAFVATLGNPSLVILAPPLQCHALLCNDVTMKCNLGSNQIRAEFSLYEGNHVEPEKEIRNRAYFHAARLRFTLKAGTKSSSDLVGSEIASKQASKQVGNIGTKRDTSLWASTSMPQTRASFRAMISATDVVDVCVGLPIQEQHSLTV